MENRMIIAGSRNFCDYDFLKNKIICFFKESNKRLSDFAIVSGCARGVDTLGIRFAKENSLKLYEFPANWSLGKNAGMIRNSQMASFAYQNETNNGLLIAFWDGKSHGTKHMIQTARQEGLDVKIFYI